jgi:phage terminase small subunit
MRNKTLNRKWGINMTDAQKRFCEEYLIDLNATRAYKVAYPSCKKDSTARANGSRMLTNANIQNYITERQQKLSKETQITQERVLNELAKIAFSDIRELFDESGALKKITDIQDEMAGAISSIESVDQFETIMGIKVKTGELKKIKLNDKSRALEMLARHLGMFNDKVDVNANLRYEDYVKSVEDEEEY